MPLSCLVMDGLVRSEKFSRIRLTCGGLQPLSKSLYSGMYYCDLSRSFFPCVMVHAYLCKLRGIKKREKGERTRLQFFAIVFVASFAYYILPGHFFPSLSALSFVCWIWKRSITAQQIGAGLYGLGIGFLFFSISRRNNMRRQRIITESKENLRG